MRTSSNIVRVIKSRRMRWAGNVACERQRRGAQRVLVVRRDRKRQLAKSRRSWEDNIKMDLQEIQFECGLDSYDSRWAQVASDVNAVMYIRFPPQKERKLIATCGTLSFSSRTLLHEVGWLVGWLVGWMVGWLVGWLVG